MKTFRRILYSIAFTIGSMSYAQPAPSTYVPTDFYAIDVLDRNEDLARQKLGAQARAMLMNQKYDDLDAWASSLRDSKKRMPNGDWALQWYYAAFKLPDEPDNPDSWTTLITLLQEWCRAKPESATAKIACAVGLTGYAWEARGNDWAENVSEASWTLMQKRLAQAKQMLSAARDTKTKCPHWYAAMQRIALNEQWERSDYEQLYSDAIKFEPSYYAYYQFKAYYLLPRWHGEPGEWEKYAASVADSGVADASAIYARIVWHLCQSLQVNLFKESSVSWPRLKRSFDEWIKAYPDSFETVSAFCIHSGYAGDCETMRNLFAVIGNRADLHVWYTEDNFLKKRAWAFKKCQ